MEELKDQITERLLQIETMKKFIDLSLRREGIADDYKPLIEDVEKTRKLMLGAYQKLNDEVDIMEDEQDQLMRRMRKQQSRVIDLLTKRQKEKQLKEKSFEEDQALALESACYAVSARKLLAPPGSACKGLAKDFSKLNVNNGCITPKMTIPEYKESPLVRRKHLSPIPLSFLEFDVQVSTELFDTIPKYMRGRSSVDELNEFLESAIVACFTDKYKLMNRQSSSVRNRCDLDLWKLFNDQASYLPGKYFITSGDISRKLNKMLDKKLQNRLTMLRHIGILQEKRIKQTVCFVWNVK